jgi:hypothetical protein
MEREAARLYALAGLEIGRSAPPAGLARRLLGTSAVRVVPASALPAGGAIARVGSSWRIYLREGIPGRQARFTVVHELSHWALGPGASEEDCDALAARLLAPRPAFERALRQTGASYTRLARWFGCTETFAALRYGEVTDEPLVVVAPANVRIRGRSYSWPSEPTLRELARAPRLHGVRKARLRDDPVRVAMRAG